MKHPKTLARGAREKRIWCPLQGAGVDIEGWGGVVGWSLAKLARDGVVVPGGGPPRVPKTSMSTLPNACEGSTLESISLIWFLFFGIFQGPVLCISLNVWKTTSVRRNDQPYIFRQP